MFIERSLYRVLLGTDDSSRDHRLMRKLSAFADLPSGWNHGEGVPVDRRAIQGASFFVDLALTLQLAADVFPGVNGECSVTFYEGDKSVEVIIDPNDRTAFGVHVEKGRGFKFETIAEREKVPLDDTVDYIRGLRVPAWSSSEYSLYGSSTQEEGGFQISSSNSHLVMT